MSVNLKCQKFDERTYKYLLVTVILQEIVILLKRLPNAIQVIEELLDHLLRYVQVVNVLVLQAFRLRQPIYLALDLSLIHI